MSVYRNDEPKYLYEALYSTCYEQNIKPTELVLVADGLLSTELYQTINDFIAKFPCCNIRLHQIDKNVGLGNALNIGLGLCNYDLVARMDADDISLPHRFERQLQFLSANPSIGVCGAYVEEVQPDSLKVLNIRKVPLEHDSILCFAKKRSPVSHPSVMFRKSKVLKFGGYPPFRKSQDYALWSLLLVNNVKFGNIPEVLLRMRTGEDLQLRRGISHFKYEFSVLKFQYQIGFLNFKEFVSNSFLRFILRALPSFLRAKIYKHRNKTVFL